MTISNELWVNKADISTMRSFQVPLSPLQDGQLLVEINQFGLSANNLTYAVSAKKLRYWEYFPVDEGWGQVPVWGFGTIKETKSESIRVGERIWGFMPMASHAVLTVGNIDNHRFVDASPHRLNLPETYNTYSRVDAVIDPFSGMDIERCLLFPLFGTSFLIYDFLKDNEFFGVDQIVIGSVSSKTAYGLAYMLKQDGQVQQRVVGLTSQRNVDFVEKLDCCDQLLSYERYTDIDRYSGALFVDMAGNSGVTSSLHHHLGERMHKSYMVGATHWQSATAVSELPGAKPEFFFAPSHIEKREREWGAGVVQSIGMKHSASVASDLGRRLSIEWIKDPDCLKRAWMDLQSNRISPGTGIMVSLAS